MLKKILGILLGLIFVLALIPAILFGPTILRMNQLIIHPVDDNLTLFEGGGCNSMVLISNDRMDVLVVDTKMGGGASRLRKFVDEKAPGARVTVVNTHDHTDHVQGNRKFPGARWIAAAYKPQDWKKSTGLDRLPDIGLTPGREHTLAVGRDTVHVRNMGRAHTHNDMVVYIPGRRLLMTGDILFCKMHPVLFKQAGTHVASWIETFERLLEWDIDTVVPGHGPITGKTGLLEGKNYFTSIRNALDDEAELERLKKRYEDYYSLPLFSGFGKTVAYIRAEEAES